ncbi:MAG: DUF4272 domain-containing protein [Planktomarina sp.]
MTKDEQNPSGNSSAIDRKGRSIVVLKNEDVAHIEHLPYLENDADVTLPTEAQIVDRIFGLMIVAYRGEIRDDDFVQDVIAQLGVPDVLTAKEREYLDNPTPADHIHGQQVWRWEAINVLLWSLGYVETLLRPEFQSDVRSMVQIIKAHKYQGLLKSATLRTVAEILDAADLIYRYHWAVVDARVNASPAPAGLDGSVVYERHYALNWLIGSNDEAWDQISTDT